jgi:hypothetical protein
VGERKLIDPQTSRGATGVALPGRMIEIGVTALIA